MRGPLRFMLGASPRAIALSRAAPATRAYIAAVEAADGRALEIGVLAALAAFADWRIPLGGTCCVLAGARTLSGALVPLVGPAPTGANLTAGDYDRRMIMGDGLSKYISTNYNNNADAQNSQHALVGLARRSTDVRSLFGAGTSETGALGFRDETTSWRYRSRNASSGLISASASETGVVGMSRTVAADVDVYRLGSITTASLTSQAPFNGSILILARGTSGLPADFSNAAVNGYSFGSGFSAAMGAEFVGRWTAMIAAISAALT